MFSSRLYIYHVLVSLIPATRLFRLKAKLLRWAGANVGDNVRIASSAKFLLTGKLCIGENTWIGHEVMIVGGSASVTVGRDVDIAPRVSIITGSHKPFGNEGKAAGDGYSEPIIIGNGAWVGACSTVLGGVSIGSQSIVAAGSLVRKDVVAGSVVGGVPAMALGKRD